MLEIYNENLRDLLVDGRSGGVNKLDILATQASGCNVPGATQVCVRRRVWCMLRRCFLQARHGMSTTAMHTMHPSQLSMCCYATPTNYPTNQHCFRLRCTTPTTL